MRITRSLNLAFPIYTDNGEVWVHTTPVGRDVYHQYFDVIAQTVSQIHRMGLNTISGPSVAAMMLRKVAETSGVWENNLGQVGVSNGLVAEIRRLTNVIISGPNGWTTLPYVEALRRDIFDEGTQEAIEGGATFFTCLSLIHGWQRERLLAVLSVSGMLPLGGMPSVWKAQVTSSNCTEFAASLPKSTEIDSSGETESTS